MQRRPKLLGEKQHASRRTFRLSLEALEGRAVLSVCGVSCDFDDGILSVQGTKSHDLIDVRYDADRSLLSVIGASDELVAEYPLSAIRQLNVHGLEGNDVFGIDSRIKVPIILNGGEGEDALLASNSASAHVHSHGSAGASPFLQSSIERILTAVPATTIASLAPSSGPTVTAISSKFAESIEDDDADASFNPDTVAFSSFSGSLASAGPLYSVGTLLLATNHASHSEPVPSMSISTSHTHDSVTSLPSSSTAAMATPGHSHVPVAMTAHQTAKSLDMDGEGESLASGHDEHESSKTTNEPASKLVPKPCTVSRSGGLVVTSVDGKRQCNCPEKELAAAEATRQILSDGPLSVTKSLFGKGDDCIPCQSLAFLAGPGGVPLSDWLPTIPGARNLMLDHLSGADCPEKEALATADNAVSEAPWLSGLPLVGYSLLATSAVLLPTLIPRKKTEDKRAPTTPAVDWLFGRLNVELLVDR